MNGLEKITEKILAEARAEAESIIADANQKSQAILDEYSTRAEAIRAKVSEQTRKESESMVARAKSSAAMIRRNVLLEARAKLIDRAFNEAYAEMKRMPSGKYLEFLINLLIHVLNEKKSADKESLELYGEEDMPVSDYYEVVFNKEDRDRYGKAVLDGMRRMAVGKYERSFLDKVVLSKECAPIDGGLILRCGNIESNASLERLFAETRESMEAEVGRILFEEKRNVILTGLSKE